MTRPSAETMTPSERALHDIDGERERQHAKWGRQRHDFPVWLTVLSEEVGELAQATLHYRETMTDQRLARMREEAVQVAAVAVAIIEHIYEVEP